MDSCTKLKLKQISFDVTQESFLIVNVALSLFLKTLDHFSSFEIFAGVVHSAGVNLFKTSFFNVLLSLFNVCPVLFTTLRPPLDRAKSLYYYLRSNLSRHEPTRDSIQNVSPYDYFKNKYYTDSWLVRQLTDSFFTEKVSENDVHKAVLILNNFLIEDIDCLRDLYFRVFQLCYPTLIEIANVSDLIANKTEYPSDVSEFICASSKFADVFAVDEKIYKQFCVSSRVYFNISANEKLSL